MKEVINKFNLINNLISNTLIIDFPDNDEESIRSNEGYIVSESMTLKQSLSEDGRLGGCVASEFNIQLVSNDNRRFSTDLRGKWINVSFEHYYSIPLCPNDTLYPENEQYPGEKYNTETVRLFSGYIDVAERDQSDSSKISITAYDIFAKMNTFKCTQKVVDLFKNEYSYSGENRTGAPLSEYISLCTSQNEIKKLPFTYDDIYSISQADWKIVASMTTSIPMRNKPFERSSEDVTYGDILRWICELLGAYAVIKPNETYGKLKIIAGGSTEVYDSYFECTAEDYETYPYAGVIIPYYYYNEGRVDELTKYYQGETDYLTVCISPSSEMLRSNSVMNVQVEYFRDNDDSNKYLSDIVRLVKSNKRVTSEKYVTVYGDKVLYAAQICISNLDSCTITKIILKDDNNNVILRWDKNNASPSDVNKTAHIIESSSQAVALVNAISDFSFYDMTDNIFAWDEIETSSTGGTTYELGRINQFYNNGHLKHRIPKLHFRPFTATVEGRTWLEVGDYVKINIPDTDCDGCIYDEITGLKMDCDGYLVDETGAYLCSDGTVISRDEDTGEYANKPVLGSVRTKEIRSIVYSRTLTGIQSLTDELETKDTN